MSEWHIPPDYINNNWTDELLKLMIEELCKRKDKERQMISDHKENSQLVSDKELFNQLGNKIKVAKK